MSPSHLLRAAALAVFFLPTFVFPPEASPASGFYETDLISRLRQAELLKSRGSYEEAVNAFEEILDASARAGKNDLAWSARYSLGFLHWNIGRIDVSENYFRAAFDEAAGSEQPAAVEATRDALEIVQTYRIARSSFNSGDLSDAREHFETGIRLSEAADSPEFSVKFLRQLSMVSWVESNYPEYYVLNSRALSFARDINHSLEISRCLNNIGLYFWKISEYEKALDAYEESLRLAQETSNRRTEADCLNNISLIYLELGYFDRALEYATQCLDLENASGNTENLSVGYNNIGLIYRQKSLETENPADSETALTYFMKGLESEREFDSKRMEIKLLNNIATVLSDQKKFGEAKIRLTEALTIAEELRDREKMGTIYTNLGIVHFHLGRPEESTRFYQKAIDIALEFQSGQILWEAYLEMGNALAGKNRFEEAAESYRRSISVIEDIRSTINLEEYKAGFIGTDKRLDAYHRLIALLARQHEASPSGPYAAEAFQVLERAKARAFLDSLEVSEVSLNHGIGIHQANREKELAREISAVYTAMLAPGLSSKHSKDLLDRLDELENELKLLKREIRAKNPAYADLKYPEPLTLEKARKKLPSRKTVYLSYSIGREESWAFALGPSGLKIYSVPPRQALQDLVYQHRKAVSDRDNRDFSTGTRLYRKLVEPGLPPGGIEHIVVVPDDILHLLPFETLRSSGADNAGIWLVEKAAVSYVPSLSVLRQIHERRRTAGRFSKDLLAFGDPEYGENSGASDPDVFDDSQAFLPFPSSFARLRFSRNEVMRISSLFKPHRTDIVLGGEATENAVKSAALSDYRIIHFAAHGIIDDKNPGRSAIVLSLDEDSIEDGFLQMREIFNLRMSADLVVLSACKTGLGRFIRGEGIEGLVRAFFYSGASAAVMSLWAVNDEATSLLMQRFYRHLRSSRSPAEALRTAKLEMIGSEATEHPFYWAGFILTGKSDTVLFSKPWHIPTLVLISLFLGLLTLAVLRKISRRRSLFRSGDPGESRGAASGSSGPRS